MIAEYIKSLSETQKKQEQSEEKPKPNNHQEVSIWELYKRIEKLRPFNNSDTVKKYFVREK